MPRLKTGARKTDAEYAATYRAKRLAEGGRRLNVLLSAQAAEAMERQRAIHGSDTAAIERWLIGPERGK